MDLKVLDELFTMSNPESKALKESFDAKDRMLVLLYFRWLTRRGARNMGIARLEVLEDLSPESKKWLEDHGMADISDWEFAGMVDFGPESDITCSRGGHRLRYAYYAVSPSTQKELVFGRNCASDFFDINAGLLGHLTNDIDKAKNELRVSFSLGRAPKTFGLSPAVTMLQLIRRNEDFAKRCYYHIGRTVIELWASFVSRGITPPDTLLKLLSNGFLQAAQDYFKSKSGGEKAINTYLAVRDNEKFVFPDGLNRNKGVVTRGDFIYPLTSLSLFDAIRTCIFEEACVPSSLSAAIDIFAFWDDITELESLIKEKQYQARCSRAELIVRGLSDALEKDIKSPLDCLIIASMRNDLRLVTYFFGLSANSGNFEKIKTALNFDSFRYCWLNEDCKGIGLYSSPHLKRTLLVLLFWLNYKDILSSIQNSVEYPSTALADSSFPGFKQDLRSELSTFSTDSEEEYDEIDEAIEELEDFDAEEYDEEYEDYDFDDEDDSADEDIDLNSLLFGNSDKGDED